MVVTGRRVERGAGDVANAFVVIQNDIYLSSASSWLFGLSSCIPDPASLSEAGSGRVPGAWTGTLFVMRQIPGTRPTLLH
eukprot:scaffold91506_cov16-Prasinocladus_malaysianus.AAC.1